MPNHIWVQEFSGAVTVCDPEGIILEMNDKAVRHFQSRGGEKLIGTNVFDCHPEPARKKLKQLMETKKTNVYTSERNSAKRLIYQSPWSEKGEYKGFVEIIFDIPDQMPHFVRDG